jgi:spore coat polysaccharide biosynthesis protein SpsF
MTAPLVVVQARTGSTRLPGKILMPLAGAPLLARMIERVRAAKTPLDVAVATTTDAVDDAVAALAGKIGVRLFRGHPTDLLDRHYEAAREAKAEIVVKIPSDCPLIDPAVIDRVLGAWSAMHERGESPDYASNLHPATYPDGNDVEVMSMAALETAWREASKPHEREHTTPFLWDQPERFKIANVAWETGRDLSMSHRFTIDYEADYRFIAAVYDALWTGNRPIFSLEEILQLLEEQPELHQINAEYAGVNWYRHHLRELRTVSASETRSLEPSV